MNEVNGGSIGLVGYIGTGKLLVQTPPGYRPTLSFMAFLMTFGPICTKR